MASFLGVSQAEVAPLGRPGAGESDPFLGMWGWAPTGVCCLGCQTGSPSPHSEFRRREGWGARREAGASRRALEALSLCHE